ncbi:MAG TPA: hypothetical protein VL202_01200 [Pararhizobium sp.]|uniref:hypothetical protein n=1 Tax=Pararhizobium sp. TaxID=1977563 RepID=UPI002C9A8C00|nr:hypothetical protein [Pararhizobium sp.]HTO29787.1 hypothetical protein [Pararhizobium sp.]
MNLEISGEGLPRGAGGRGLSRLMLRLPRLRGKLQALATKSVPVTGLFEAYEDASVALQRLRAAPGEDNCSVVREYEMICSEIETEIIEYCRAHRV